MGEAARLNLGIGFMQEPDKTGKTMRRLPKMPRNTRITMDQVILWIKDKKLPKEREDKLIKAAQNTPHGALYNFVHNYKRYL